MNNNRIVTVLISLLVCAALPAQETDSQIQKVSHLRPTNLRCEYLESPLGIDVKKPRMSWKLKAADPQHRGVYQTACHILVAGSEKLLAENEGNLWDSGEVKSPNLRRAACLIQLCKHYLF